MEATVSNTGTEGKVWGGGNKPLRASYGKMMMWFFILSDALTFSGFLAAYGFSRFKFIDSWPIADEVFTHVPFLHGQELPMIYVAFMTFILIFSSVTMVSRSIYIESIRRGIFFSNNEELYHSVDCSK